MTLPTFLGIGVPRAGTTWLHELLSAHPDVYLPSRRKEVRFFDRYHDRGLGWYESFFCEPPESARYRAIGEISPQYLYDAEAPARIEAAIPDVKLLVMLRQPVDRAYSQYGFVRQRRNFSGSFEEFLATRPEAVEKGFYSTGLKRYLRRFDRSQLLVLLFEEAVRGHGGGCAAIADFLGIPVGSFPASVGKVNPSTVPKHGSVSGFAVSMGRRLRRNHMEGVVDLGAKLGARRFLTGGDPMPQLDPERRSELSRRYEVEFRELERCVGLDLSPWRV